MNIWDKIKKIISVIMVVVICITGLNYISKVLQYKKSEIKNHDFFLQDENFDVLFFGTSHVIDGIYPMELWREYGMVSYNFGMSGCSIPTAYWIIQNALDYTTPKVIVLDCSQLSNEAKIPDHLEYAHRMFDTFPLTRTKLDAINDIVPEDNRLEFIWDFWTYHYRWDEIKVTDFYPILNPDKGAVRRLDVATPNEFNRISRDKKLETDTTGVQYLERILTECKEKNIQVVLTYLPFPAKENKQKEANRVYEIAEEYNVPYLNFLDMELVDFDIDLNDAGSHLNAVGARTVTSYIGKYLVDNYDIANHQNDEEYAFWKQDYAEYKNSKIEDLQTQLKLDSYLMQLNDSDFTYEVLVNNNVIFDDEKYCKLLNRLGVNESDFSAPESEEDADISIKVYDKEMGNLVDSVLFNITVKKSAFEVSNGIH